MVVVTRIAFKRQFPILIIGCYQISGDLHVDAKDIHNVVTVVTHLAF